MLNWYLTPRHWSPREDYATGDVLINLLNAGWRIDSAQATPGSRRAPRFDVTLARAGETLDLLVLDGPAVRAVLSAESAIVAVVA